MPSPNRKPPSLPLPTSAELDILAVLWRLGAATVREVASASEVILLATVWKARRDALASAGDVRGKILIDAMNPLLGDLSGLGARRKTSWKNPGFEGGKVFLPYCGNDGESKSRVHALATELGFDAFNVGP